MNYVFGRVAASKAELAADIHEASAEAGDMAAAVSAAALAYIEAMQEPGEGEKIACNVQGNDDGLQPDADRSCGAPVRISVSYVKEAA